MITKLCHVNAFDNLLLLETKPKVVKIHKKLEKHRQTNKNLGLFIIFSDLSQCLCCRRSTRERKIQHTRASIHMVSFIFMFLYNLKFDCR